MESMEGQTFLNYAYSWGAAIVILGTLFKLTHLPGANFFLFLGMGTEVLVFVIAAFDRPFSGIGENKRSGKDAFGQEGLDGELIDQEEMLHLLMAMKEAYAKRVEKLNEGNETIVDMNRQVEELVKQMKVLNGMCARMICAIKNVE